MNRSNRHTQATPLASSQLQVTITDLVAEYELRHVFRNDSAGAIEAIYSFPVPLDSAFMGVEAILAGEQLVARVLPRKQASRRYDDAIADGDSPVLLEWLEPGMLCVNLGNLKAGEEGEVVLRFAAPLRTADGAARFSLPLVHRPRYGRSRLEELVGPQHDFAVEHSLEVSIRVQGLLARAPVSCATHAARFSIDGEAQCLRLNQAMLDRDLVLVFELPESYSAQGRLVRDGEQAIGILTFTTPASLRAAGPCDLCLVLDGSGSMEGDAIAQSRDALRAVAGVLQDEDRIQILQFGNEVVPLFRRPLKASSRVRDAMTALAEAVDADMGGTEMGLALDYSIDALTTAGKAQGCSQAIILVTDGAVQPGELEAANSRAIEEGIRIFVVAVGSSAGADVLEPLATSTGGVLERAVPAEPIDDAVMRQLRRAREALPLEIEIDWGNQDVRSLPLSVIYPGDAVTAVAMLPAGQEFLPRVMVGKNADELKIPLGGAQEAPALRAIAGRYAWWNAEGETRAQLALRYGLVTDETSAVLVKVRAQEDKAAGLPTIVPVKHMVPGGSVALGCAAPSNDTEFECCDIYDYAESCDVEEFDPLMGAKNEEMKLAGDQYSARHIAEGRQALRAALDKYLLMGDLGDFNVSEVFALINPDLLEYVIGYVNECTVAPLDLSGACDLLEGLALMGVGAPLTDEDEARLAVLRHVGSTTKPTFC